MELAQVRTILEDATSSVFATMLSTELRSAGARLDPEPVQSSEVTGMIGFTGGLVGCVSIHCGLSQAREFAGRLLGLERDEIGGEAELRDAIGELTNMIAGNVKTTLAGEADIDIALPTVIVAPKPDIRVRGGAGYVVSFEDPSGSFEVEFTLSARPGAAR